MAAVVANSCFSVFNSTVKFSSFPSRSRSATLQRSTASLTPKAIGDRRTVSGSKRRSYSANYSSGNSDVEVFCRPNASSCVCFSVIFVPSFTFLHVYGNIVENKLGIVRQETQSWACGVTCSCSVLSRSICFQLYVEILQAWCFWLYPVQWRLDWELWVRWTRS